MRGRYIPPGHGTVHLHLLAGQLLVKHFPQIPHFSWLHFIATHPSGRT